MRKRIILAIIAALLGVSGLAPAQETGIPSAAAPPAMIYVVEFLLDVQAIQQDEGLLGGRKLGSRLKGNEDPHAQAAKLVESLADALIAALREKGLPSGLLPLGTGLPPDGWLVEGEFLEVDEGSRLKRAVIGFGSGSAKMQVAFQVSDLARPEAGPFLASSLKAESGGKGPGAAVMLNPYTAAAKLVLSKDPSGKEIKKLAADITDGIVKYMRDLGMIKE